KATDKALNVSQIVTRSWTVEEPADETAPVVTALAVGTPGATASFTISSDDPDATVECMLTKDGTAGAWEACQSPQTYSDLAPGTYVLSVRGTDEAGNISAVYATDSWTVAPPVDTTRPVVTITPVKISGGTAKFALTASEPGVSFQCKLAKNGVVIQRWAACGPTKNYWGLKPATYALSVRATDAAGNVSLVVRYTWKVKTVTTTSR
ncbi:MAG TPA: hypothetical protein VLQ78_09905, partial [Ornithinibacter sp.]|nr:hypothetical protein [Ornithinibacter sp.]